MSDDDRDLDIDSDEEGFGGSGGGGGGQDKRAHHNALVFGHTNSNIPKFSTKTAKIAGEKEAGSHQGQLHGAEGRHPQLAGSAGGQMQQGSDPEEGRLLETRLTGFE